MKKLGMFGYEKIDGTIIEVSPLSISNQIVLTEIAAQLYNNVKDKYIVLAGPVQLYIDSDNVFLPDVVCFSKEKKQVIEADRIYQYAEWVCEVLTPETVIADLEKKADLYFDRTFCQEYWTVDPYSLEVTGFLLSRKKEVIKVISQGEINSAYLSVHIQLGTILSPLVE